MVLRAPTVLRMVFRPFLYESTACASYLFGCLSHSMLGVVDPHVELVEIGRAHV